jgi:hypothetical protein
LAGSARFENAVRCHEAGTSELLGDA